MRPFFRILTISILAGLAGFPVYGQKKYYDNKQHSVSIKDFDEAAPVMLGNKMVYISNWAPGGIKSETDMEKQPFFRIVESERKEDGKWTSQKLFSEALTSHFHTGPVTFNQEGNMVVFSRCLDEKTNNRNVSKFGLFFADLQNGEWGNIREFEFNDDTSNTVYPSLSRDGKLLYFSSDRAGGFGGFDLYVSRLVNGNWTSPENLGPVINTAFDERYPCIHPSGRLYFSTKGHDIKTTLYQLFYSEQYNGKWINPVKLPEPFNKGANYYSICFNDDFKTAFYTRSSGNRIGKNMDIWTYTLTMPVFQVSQKQRENNYCFIFFEENTVSLDTTLYLYEWDFGDKSKARAIEAKHCFAGPGTYKVSLNVIDRLTKEVLFNQAEYDIDVEKIIQPYITSPETAKANTEIQFSGLESYFKDIVVGDFFWDFGDGTRGVGASIKHLYRGPGTYTVKLGVIEEVKKSEIPQEFCSFKTIVITEN